MRSRIFGLLLTIVLANAAIARADSFALVPGEVLLETVGCDVDLMTYHVRVRPARNADTRLTVYWNYADSAYHTRAEVAVAPLAADDGITGIPVRYTVLERTAGADSLICQGDAAAIATGSADGGISVVLQTTASGARLKIGGRKTQAEAVVPFRHRNPGAVGLSADRPAQVLRNSLMLSELPPREYKSTADITSRWSYLDRNTQPGGVPPGGYYSLGLVPEDDGVLAIVYLAGAPDGDMAWQPGQVKGRLRPTVFRNHYDLEWLDSRGRRVADESYASISDDGHILELNFPLYKSQIRFRLDRTL